ncbi:MAG: CBS domain-containing protein [Nitrososphaerales archaeon]
MQGLVKEIQQEPKFSLVVSDSTRMSDLVQTIARSPYSSIFVVDRGKKFKGLVLHADVIDWAKFQLGDLDKLLVLHNLGKQTVKDQIRRYSEQAFVKPEDDLIKALGWMLSSGLIVAPVVKGKKLVGEVTLAGILIALTLRNPPLGP